MEDNARNDETHVNPDDDTLALEYKENQQETTPQTRIETHLFLLKPRLAQISRSPPPFYHG